MNKRNRRFEDHLGLHHQGCDVIPELLILDLAMPLTQAYYEASRAIFNEQGVKVRKQAVVTHLKALS
jgi:hypothetical protein